MCRRLCFVLAVGLLASVPLPTNAQDPPGSSQGWIEILEPEEWRGAGERGIVVRARRSLRIVGRAGHSTGIREVRLNGERAALRVEPTGETRFTGYVRVRADAREVEVTVYPVAGRRFTQLYHLEALPAEQSYDSPDEAWQESEGGFRGRRWAVVVGISDYQDERIPSLQYADDDALAIHEFLTSEQAGLGGFEPENVRLLVNEEATNRNVRSALFSFLRSATEDDLVIIYFAGHGTADPERLEEHYLLTHDSDIDDLPATALLMEDVSDAVRRVYYHHLVIIADACHSAGLGGQVGARDFALNRINQVFLDRLEGSTGGYATFTASQVTQLSREDSRWGGGHGVFTHFILEALEGAGDDDEDGIVTLGEMMEYTRDRVRRETRNAQIPTISQSAFDWSLPLSIVPLPAAAVEEVTVPEEEARRAEEMGEVDPGETPGIETDLMYNPQGAFLRGMLIPGLGEFYVDRPGRGVFFLGGAGGALAWGILSTKVIEDCLVQPSAGQTCPPAQLVGTTTERPYLVPGLGIAAALSLIGAIDAYVGAKSARRPGTASGAGTDPTVSVWPWNAGLRPRPVNGRVEVDLLRIRF